MQNFPWVGGWVPHKKSIAKSWENTKEFSIACAFFADFCSAVFSPACLCVCVHLSPPPVSHAQDCDCATVITQPAYLDQVNSLHPTPVVINTQHWTQAAAFATSNEATNRNPKLWSLGNLHVTDCNNNFLQQECQREPDLFFFHSPKVFLNPPKIFYFHSPKVSSPSFVCCLHLLSHPPPLSAQLCSPDWGKMVFVRSMLHFLQKTSPTTKEDLGLKKSSPFVRAARRPFPPIRFHSKLAGRFGTTCSSCAGNPQAEYLENCSIAGTSFQSDWLFLGLNPLSPGGGGG